MINREQLVKKLGQAVKQWRTLREKSQMELASDAGLDKTYVGRIEQAKVNPTVDSLLKIADALDLELIIEFRPRRKRRS